MRVTSSLLISAFSNALVMGFSFALSATLHASPAPHTEVIVSQNVRIRILESALQLEMRGLDLRYGNPRAMARMTGQRVTSWICKKGVVNPNKLATSGLTAEMARHLQMGFSIEAPSGFLVINGRAFRDRVRVVPLAQGGCDVVNEVDLEKYLAGLVNSEISARWAEATIDAQVIAARTYAIYQMGEARKKKFSYYDLDSTTKDQVYEGAWKEDYRAIRSVERTRGKVLRDRKSKALLKAFYHSTCGGRTELPENVWGKPHHGFRRSVTCPYCKSSPKLAWGMEITSDELESTLQQKLRITAHLERFEVLERDAQGRVKALRAVWRQRPGSHLESRIKAGQFREWFGAARLQSTWFGFAPVTFAMGHPNLGRSPANIARTRIVISGRGFGHGVGMCQWGAKVMGEKGFHSQQILTHYYPDAAIAKF